MDLGFQRTEIISIPNTPNLNGPVDFRFLPDGRIVVAEKFGAIAIVEVVYCRSRSSSHPH